jgi:undecaprenyl-diphosphatase
MDVIVLFKALLLGIIEGITEFLPISSTGHLIIAEEWLGHRSDMFNIVIQAGAILAVTVIYWPRLMSFLTGWRDRETRDYLLKLIAAFLVTAVLGLIAKKLGFKLPESVTPIAWALIIGGVWMFVAEEVAARRPESTRVSWLVAIVVGLAQVIAGIFPGTSRSASTIFAAMLLGTGNRAAATEFAFLVGIPTMYAASAFELLGTLKDGGAAGEDWLALIVAFIASAVTAFVAVKWLLGFIQGHRFTSFAFYRIGLGFLLFALVELGLVT